MALYRIFRMKDAARQQFRLAPHVSGAVSVKPKDFEQLGQVEGQNEYDAWRASREAGESLQVGDLLESEDGRLRICKFVGFEPAEWVLPEPKHAAEPEPAPQSITA
ncbi:MAG: hypothetical protein ACLQKA_12920 [Bryobacteraceae bacterium]